MKEVNGTSLARIRDKGPTGSRYLAGILFPLVGNLPSRVYNSYVLSQFFRTESLQEGGLLASFNELSLFPNVCVHLAMTVARQQLQDDGSFTGCMTFSVYES